jgi:hypothetical protein
MMQKHTVQTGGILLDIIACKYAELFLKPGIVIILNLIIVSFIIALWGRCCIIAN